MGFGWKVWKESFGFGFGGLGWSEGGLLDLYFLVVRKQVGEVTC